MNRDEMIEVATKALVRVHGGAFDPDALELDAMLVVDALVAAGCVPSDELTQAAQATLDAMHGMSRDDWKDNDRLWDALCALSDALDPPARCGDS